jgi:hypothetical protein
VQYTGTSTSGGASFTGCSVITGTVNNGDTLAIPAAATVTGISGTTINVDSTTNFPGMGTLVDPLAGGTVQYTGVTDTPDSASFTGCTVTGTVNTGDPLVLSQALGTPLPQRAGPDVVANGEWDTSPRMSMAGR